jgi:hypothetical protein
MLAQSFVEVMIKIKTHGFFYALNFGWSKDILLFAFKSHANLVINASCILLYLSKALYIECNIDYNSYCWVN